MHTMTSEGLAEMFKGEFADTSTEFLLLMLMGGRATPSIMHRRGAKDPHWREQEFVFLRLHIFLLQKMLTINKLYSTYYINIKINIVGHKKF